MKTKNILTYLVAAVLTLFVFSCEDTIEREISPEVPEGCLSVFFPTTNIQEYELEPAAPTEIEIIISREVTQGAANVPITIVENTEDIFEVPQTVSFADGEAEKTFKVTFPNAGEGKPYNLKLAVEGEQFVNHYLTDMPLMATKITRIKWEEIEEPMIYIDGTFNYLWGAPGVPMYITSQKAELTDVIRYRFKNIYASLATDKDENGILNGFYYNDPGDFDEDNDYYTIIEIDKKSGEVSMNAHAIGINWGYGMISIGSIYGNQSENKNEHPLGKKEGNKIVFNENSLYFSMANYQSGKIFPSDAPTIIYFSLEAYLEDNLRIDNFNDVEYMEIEGAVSEFESKAYNDSWPQSIAKAIDIDENNEESQFKDLYYLANLYSEGFGLAFYETNGKIKIPNNQKTGRKAFGKDVYVSSSDSIVSSMEINSKGVTVYTLGLMFHFEDDTKLGDFAELFFFSENPASYEKEDFIGKFIMTGESQFTGEDPAEMNVEIKEGDDENTLIITGIDFAKEIIADFNPSTSIMSIAPQPLADIEDEGDILDMTLYTTTPDGKYSTSASMDFTFNMVGNLVLTAESEADGYLIDSEEFGDWVDGFYDLVFTPNKTKSASIKTNKVTSFKTHSAVSRIEKFNTGTDHNFQIKGKKSHKQIKNNLQGGLIF